MSLSPAAERLLQKGAVTVLRKRALAAKRAPAALITKQLVDPTPKKWQTKIPKSIRRAKDPKEKLENQKKQAKNVMKQLEDKRKKESAAKFKPREMLEWLRPNHQDNLRVNLHRQMLSSVNLNKKRTLSTMLNVALFRTHLHMAEFQHVPQSSRQAATAMLRDNFSKLARISARANISLPEYRISAMMNPPKAKPAGQQQQAQQKGKSQPKPANK